MSLAKSQISRLALSLLLVSFAASISVRGDSSIATKDLPRVPSKAAQKLLLYRSVPEYPAVAKMNYIQGLVRVLATINVSGVVKEAHVISGHPFLAVPALVAVKTWVFRPAEARPGPPEFQTYVDVHFSLHTKKIEPVPLSPEQDLGRQIHPPELAANRAAQPNTDSVRLRVLIGDDGHVIDSQPLDEEATRLDDARKTVAKWNFRPARWGALPVPWYLDVSVPVDAWSNALGAASSGVR